MRIVDAVIPYSIKKIKERFSASIYFFEAKPRRCGSVVIIEKKVWTKLSVHYIFFKHENLCVGIDKTDRTRETVLVISHLTKKARARFICAY